jgi:integrase
MKRMQPMTDDQLDRLRVTANQTGPREAAIIALMTRHFIRASELAGTDREGNPTGLKVSDVNLKDGTLTINRLKGSVSKTEALRPGEREALTAWLAVKPQSAWLFPGRDPSMPMDRKTVYNSFHRLCEKAGVPAQSAAPHASRHTLGQTMAEKGAQAKLIQQAAGHKSLASSGQYYEFRQSHVDAEVSRLLGLTEAA